MSRLSAIIVGTAIALVPPQIAWAGTAAEVNAIAEEIAVRIDGCSVGSGVIFRREGDTYYVLTVNHVVDFQPDYCLVITPDGQRHSTEIKPIEEDVDLAVVQFESKNNYTVGKLGNSSEVRRGKTVYVAGTPEPNEVVPEPTLRVTPGVIIGRAKQAPKGYTLIYNNTTRKGMSGGPVLNEAGEIIGIHGRGDLEDGSKENYGIPIENFSPPPASSGSKKPSQSDINGADESGKVGEGLSLPLIWVLPLGILGGGAGLLLKNLKKQNEQLLQEKELCQETAQGQQILIKSLTEKLETNQQKVTQLERDLALTQQRYDEQTTRLSQVEQLTEARLSRQSEELKSLKKQNEQLLQEKELCQETAQGQQILIESLTEKLETNQQKVTQLERDLAHTQQRYEEWVRVPARYHKLRDLLSAGKWKEADEETWQVMLQVVRREEEGWFRVEDLENFPCEDLRAIDELWVKYSDGRFGFSVQKRIWLEEGGKVDWTTEDRLEDRVGWRVKGKWQRYRDLTFDLTAPAGHLPSRLRSNNQKLLLSECVFSRAQMCEL